jgi:RimJ/RimL family protein N-acetyltransferase
MTAKMVEFLCEKTGLVPTPHLRVIGRTDEKGEIIAVVGYDNYTGTSLAMHVAAAGPYWMTKGLLRAAFDYPFNVCGCKVVLGFVPSGNTEALRLNKHLGFKTEAIIEGAHPDGALHIMSMRREDCRWIQKGA